MAFPPNLWSQLKNLTADKLIAALERDGWKPDPSSKGAIRAFVKMGSPHQRITIHYHPKKTFGPGLLKALLRDIGWNEEDFKRLGLAK